MPVPEPAQSIYKLSMSQGLLCVPEPPLAYVAQSESEVITIGLEVVYVLARGITA